MRVIVVPPSGEGEFSGGTAFKVGRGQYLTNQHVIAHVLDGGGEVWLVGPPPNGPRRAEIVASSAADLALLTASDESSQPLVFASAVPDAGDPVVALGYPGQMDAVLGRTDLAHSFSPDVTVGSLINSGETTDDTGTAVKLVHSANLWPGNSGGPLLDNCNRVVGVNTWVHTDNGFAQQNIAISAADVSRFLAKQGLSPAVDSKRCEDGSVKAAAQVPTLVNPDHNPPPHPGSNHPGSPHNDSLTFFLSVAGLLMAAMVGTLFIVARRDGGGSSKNTTKQSTGSGGW